MASWKLCLLVMLSVAASATAGDVFPFTECQQQPAYYHVNSVVKPGPAPYSYCFTIKVNIPPNCTDKCCTSALRKFEINVKPECQLSGLRLSATLNGKPAPTRPVIGPAPGNPSIPAAVLRVSNLGLDLTEADGAELCVFLGTNAAGNGCLTLDALCVPPEEDLRGTCNTVLYDETLDCCPVDIVNRPGVNCNCNATQGTLPFVASPTYEVYSVATSATYCFELDTINPVQSKCAGTHSLNKIEIPLVSRSSAIKGISISTASGTTTKLRPSWSGSVLKITPINWNVDQAKGAKVCIEIARPATLETLCGGACDLFLFNAKRDCCPSYSTVPALL